MSSRVGMGMLRTLMPRPRCQRQATLFIRTAGSFSDLENIKTGHFSQGYRRSEVTKAPSTSNTVSPLSRLPSISSSSLSSVPSRNLRTGDVHCRKESPTTDEDLDTLAKGDKVLKVKLATTRLDGILKIGLQISKNKIEKAFYEDRIRINGERPKKKSQNLFEGDEVDIVRGLNKMNREFLDVSRVEVVTLNEDKVGGNEDEYTSDEDESSESKIPAVLKRYKSLTIENYDEPWKGAVEDS